MVESESMVWMVQVSVALVEFASAVREEVATVAW